MLSYPIRETMLFNKYYLKERKKPSLIRGFMKF